MGTVDMFNENVNLNGFLESYANVRKVVYKAFIEFDDEDGPVNGAGTESE